MAETGREKRDVEWCKQYSYMSSFKMCLKTQQKMKLGLYSLVIAFIYTMVSLPTHYKWIQVLMKWFVTIYRSYLI